jgi:GT2 family glycosyltransferase
VVSKQRRLLPPGVVTKLATARQIGQANRELLDVIAKKVPASERIWPPVADRLFPPLTTPPDAFEHWCRRFIDDRDVRRIRSFCANLPRQPIISIVLAVHATAPESLSEAIASVQGQIYERWQLCLVDDASHDDDLTRILVDAALGDARIDLKVRPQRGNVVTALNEGVTMAYGSFVTFLDHDDLLPPDALAWLVAAINQNPTSRLLYTDDAYLDIDGERVNPYFKPGYDPILLLGQNYMNHLIAFERSTLEELKGFRKGTDGVQDWDLTLRATERLKPDEVTHVPTIGYLWRNPPASSRPLSSNPRTLENASTVVRQAMRRRDIVGTIEPVNSLMRLLHHPPIDLPRVHLIVLADQDTRGLAVAIESLTHTSYPNIHLTVLATPDHPDIEDFPTTVDLRVAEHTFADTLNTLVAETSDPLLCLFSGASSVRNANWLHEMAAIAMIDDIGAVGGLVLLPDGTIHNSGVTLGAGGEYGLRYHGDPGLSTGHRDRLLVNQTVSAVTGAALVVARDRYLEVGGVDPALSGALRDIDLCLKLSQAGYRCCFTPSATFSRHAQPTTNAESPSLVSSHQGPAHLLLWERWQELITADPYYNPNLADEAATCFVADPPRLCPPWNTPMRWFDLPLPNPERFFACHQHQLAPQAALPCELDLAGVTQLRLWGSDIDAHSRLALLDTSGATIANLTRSSGSDGSPIFTGELLIPQAGRQRYELINHSAEPIAITLVTISEKEERLRLALGRPEWGAEMRLHA